MRIGAWAIEADGCGLSSAQSEWMVGGVFCGCLVAVHVFSPNVSEFFSIVSDLSPDG